MVPNQREVKSDVTPLRASTSGYRKGHETRSRILKVALEAFGASGFRAVTTRNIAEEAKTNLPALTYYFGNKQGLYLACAHEIVARYRAGTGAVANVALAALRDELSPADARALLKRLLEALARFLLLSDGAHSQTAFVQREIASPGPAFEILYSELWQPGIELTADLIIQASGAQLTEAEARIRAVMLISSLTGFLSGRRVIDRALGDSDAITLVVAALSEQIDAIGD